MYTLPTPARRQIGGRLLAALLLAAGVLAAVPGSASAAELTIGDPTVSVLRVFEADPHERPPLGQSYPSVIVTAPVSNCTSDETYGKHVELVQDGHSADDTILSGMGGWDFNCSDGVAISMGKYNPEHPLHPGRVTVTVRLAGSDGVISSRTRTLTIPRTPPSAPTAVQAASSGATSATLTWRPPVIEGGATITGYRVSRTGGSGWSTTVAGTARSFRFDRLTAGTAYSFSVRAISTLGTSPAATARTVVGTPGLPTRVSARATSASTATLVWSPPATSGASPITGYRVMRNGGLWNDDPSWSTTVPATTRSWSFARLRDNDWYTLTVAAINGRGTGTPVTVTVAVGDP